MKLHILTFAVTGLNVVSGAQAQVFTDLAAFQTAIGNDAGGYTETFTGGGGNRLGPQSFFGGTPLMAYTVTAPSGLYRSGTFIGNEFANLALTITFTTNNVFAVGGNFFITSAQTNLFVPAADVTLTYSDGTTTTFTPADANGFRGYVSALPITSLVLSAPVGASRLNAIDNFVISSVPTPSAAAILALGGLLAARRRR